MKLSAPVWPIFAYPLDRKSHISGNWVIWSHVRTIFALNFHIIYYVFLGHKLQQAEIQLCKNLLMFEPIITRWFMLLLETNYPMNHWVERDGCLDLHRYIYISMCILYYVYICNVYLHICRYISHTEWSFMHPAHQPPTTNRVSELFPRLWPKATRAFLAVARAPELRQQTPRLAPENRQENQTQTLEVNHHIKKVVPFGWW